ncbi:NAD(P)H-binding protein, partial [Kitasatospora sp. NPDC001225]
MIVVTGATGNVGRPLTRALAKAGLPVTAVSRHAAPVPDGVRHVAADLADPAGLAPALAGAEALFLLLSGDLHAAGAGAGRTKARGPAAGGRRGGQLGDEGVGRRARGPPR